MKQTTNRLTGLDIIRCFAIFSVIAGHFFVLNTPFREIFVIVPLVFVASLLTAQVKEWIFLLFSRKK